MNIIYKKLLDEIQYGEDGLNTGLLCTIPLINKFLYGVQKKTYYLVGAEVKQGKSAFVDQIFILDAFDYAKAHGKKLKCFYFSLELDATSKTAKFAAFKAFKDYAIITHTAEILSKGDNKITPELKKLINKYEAYFDELYDSVIMIDGSINPTGILRRVESYCKANGTIHEETKIVGGEPITQKVYVQNNPNEYVIFVVDHIGLLKREKERDSKELLTKKQTIDKLSEYSIYLRNTYNVSPVLISQFNRSLGDIDRQRFKELRPQLSDFKESGNPAEDANCILGLFMPMRYNIPTYMDGKYDIKILGQRFNSLHILANRDGDAGQVVGLNFLGECGHFRQFPTREKLLAADYQAAINYNKFLK